MRILLENDMMTQFYDRNFYWANTIFIYGLKDCYQAPGAPFHPVTLELTRGLVLVLGPG